MAVSHIFDLTEELEGVVHRCDDAVQTVSHKFYLGIESGIGEQLTDGDRAKSAELAQGRGVLSEEPYLKCIV
jgi:non-canonical (house-cleaning) NTP pyrophosphatase